MFPRLQAWGTNNAQLLKEREKTEPPCAKRKPCRKYNTRDSLNFSKFDLLDENGEIFDELWVTAKIDQIRSEVIKRIRDLNQNEAYKNYHGVTRVRRVTQFERAVDTWNVGDYEIIALFVPSGI